jgi:hypothetical protein
MIQFKALLLSVDMLELSHEEILDACREQADAVQRSIQSVSCGRLNEIVRGKRGVTPDAARRDKYLHDRQP